MDNEFKELQTLLRLKKYEQPPQGFESYGERFLKEFHRRQRWEENQKTGFSAIWEKMSGWMEDITVPRYAYAAVVGIFGALALAINGLQPEAGNPTNIAMAGPVLSPVTAISPSVAFNSRPALALNSPLDLSDLEIESKLNVGSAATNAANNDVQPHYILDARPAGYDASFSF